ncbi:MAG TPA: hypothetical protein VK864_07925 [Longimicrobiales bacterium]|nr:hypothetical protein [Longimicrobiales bacterium]
MRRWQIVMVLLGATGLAAGCNSACTFESEPALIVTVVDSVTAQNITPGSAVVARQGFFIDSVFVAPNASQTSVSLGYDRPGIYTVTVHHAGYREWRRDGILVPGSGCGVRDPIALTTRLIP